MDQTAMEHSNAETGSTINIALSTLIPLVLGFYTARMTFFVTGRFGIDTVPVLLVVWCALLGLSALWLNHSVFRSKRTFVPFAAATVVILLVWLWQRQAFALLVPSSGLTYGYFKTPAGAKASFWVLTCPFCVGLIALSACLITVLVRGWRAGRRASLMCVIPWWLTAFLIFALPSIYLDAQGNASIFV